MPLADIELLMEVVLGGQLSSTRSVVRRSFRALREHSADGEMNDSELLHHFELGGRGCTGRGSEHRLIKPSIG